MIDRDHQASLALTPAELAPGIDDKPGSRDISPASAGASLDPRQTRAQPDWPPAVIAGAFQTGVLGVRTLKRRHVRVASFDPNPHQPGFRSVYGRAVQCPNPDAESDHWAAFMVDLARSLGARPALISSSDQFVTATARHADLLEQHFRLSPGCRLQGLLADKQSQYDLASKNGMPMPRTEDIRSAAEIARWSRE